MTTTQPLSTPGLASLERNDEKGPLVDSFVNTINKDEKYYSPEEKIWRPVFPKGDFNNHGYIQSAVFHSLCVKNRFGLASGDINLLRDNFHLSTWLLLGALSQSVLGLLTSYNYFAMIPAISLLSWQILNILLQLVGLKRNPHMENVILGKYSYHLPDEEGNLVGEPSQKRRAVIMLSTSSNHPLGMFAPGFKDLADKTALLQIELESNPEKYNYHGSTAWISNGGDRATSQRIMAIHYFDDIEGILKFAHSQAHRKVWDWWTDNAAKFDHISIDHEMFQIEAESHEAIYINNRRSGLVANNIKLANGEFVAPIIDASQGQNNTSKGRLNWVEHGKSNDRYREYKYQKAHLVCPALSRRDQVR